MVLFLIFSSQHWNSNNSQDSPPGNSTDGGKCIGAFCQVLAQSNSVVIHTLSAQDKNVDWNTAIIEQLLFRTNRSQSSANQFKVQRKCFRGIGVYGN